MTRRVVLVKVLVLLSVAALGTAGCGSSNSADSGRAQATSATVNPEATAAASPTLKVVAAFGPVAEVAAKIGGDAVTLTNLTGVGIEPHDLELSADQIDAVLDADLVLYVGQGFQPSLEKILKTRKGVSLDLLNVVQTIEGTHEDEGHEGEGHSEDEAGQAEGEGQKAHAEEQGDSAIDPHFWLDPTRFSAAGTALAKELALLRPTDEAAFSVRADEFAQEMATLDREFAAGLRTCVRREMVTAHAAFGYLADKYSLEQIAVSGVSPEAEPDAKRMAEIADLIVQRKVTTIFTEELVSPKVSEALSRDAKVQTAVLSPIEGFTPEEVAAGVTYAEKMRTNLQTLSTALGCS